MTDTRPLADPGREAAARSLFSGGEMPAEVYVARFAHTIGCSSFGDYRYRDPALGGWIDELHRLLRSPAEVERCRRTHLTAQEHAAIREDESHDF